MASRFCTARRLLLVSAVLTVAVIGVWLAAEARSFKHRLAAVLNCQRGAMIFSKSGPTVYRLATWIPGLDYHRNSSAQEWVTARACALIGVKSVLVADREGLEVVLQFPEISELHGSFLEDEDLKLIASKLPHSKVLDLSGSAGSGITDQGLAHLRPLKELRVVNVSGTWVTGRGFDGWQSAETLEELEIWGTLVDDSGISNVASFKNLRRLDISLCNLSGKCLAALGKLKRLEKLKETMEGNPATICRV
jgi:hypothetical protein